MAPPIPVHPRVVIGHAEVSHRRQTLRREASLVSITSMLPTQTRSRQRVPRRGRRAIPITAGRHRPMPRPRHARAASPCNFMALSQQGSSPPRRHSPAGVSRRWCRPPEGCRQLGQLFQCCLRAWMLVRILPKDRPFAAVSSPVQSRRQGARFPSPHRRLAFRAAMAGQSRLILTADLPAFGNILARFRHRVGTVHRLHLSVHEPPADGGVVDFRLPRKRGRPSASQRVRGSCFPGRRLSKFAFSALDHARGRNHRFHSRGTEPIERNAGHGLRQSGQQPRPYARCCGYPPPGLPAP